VIAETVEIVAAWLRRSDLGLSGAIDEIEVRPGDRRPSYDDVDVLTRSDMSQAYWLQSGIDRPSVFVSAGTMTVATPTHERSLDVGNVEVAVGWVIQSADSGEEYREASYVSRAILMSLRALMAQHLDREVRGVQLMEIVGATASIEGNEIPLTSREAEPGIRLYTVEFTAVVQDTT